ncbi:MAG: hypothetical protein ABIJ35_02505 [Acidobacteriota bacterium]
MDRKTIIVDVTPDNISDAQKGPSLYGVFNLIYDGILLADRYISTTRFQNIINKEIKRT